MSDYPEHDRLESVKVESQAQGELLAWLSEKGIHLMVWDTWTDGTIECPWCHHRNDAEKALCKCDRCGGTHITPLEITGFRADGRNIQQLLAAFHEIDLDTIETEKRAMLTQLREVS